MFNYKIFKFKSIYEYIKKREQKEGLKNVFFEKLDRNFLDLTRDEQLQRLIKVLEKNGFKIKK